MSKDFPRYLIELPGGRGKFPRFFWQPSTELRANGWPMRRLPEHWDAYLNADELREAAIKEATVINAGLDHSRGAFSRRNVAISRISYVYVLRDQQGLRKIGRSQTPLRRQKALQAGAAGEIIIELIVATPEPKRLEASLHAAFAKKRVRSEWFSETLAEIVVVLAALMAPAKP